MAKYKVTNIVYDIDYEDIMSYRTDEGISDDVSDDEVQTLIESSLPKELIVKADIISSRDMSDIIAELISYRTGFLVRTANYELIEQ